jgi:hypothetical protein
MFKTRILDKASCVLSELLIVNKTNGIVNRREINDPKEYNQMMP